MSDISAPGRQGGKSTGDNALLVAGAQAHEDLRAGERKLGRKKPPRQAFVVGGFLKERQSGGVKSAPSSRDIGMTTVN